MTEMNTVEHSTQDPLQTNSLKMCNNGNNITMEHGAGYGSYKWARTSISTYKAIVYGGKGYGGGQKDGK